MNDGTDFGSASFPAEIVPLAHDQWDDWYGKFERALGGVPKAAEERALWRDLTEVDRALAVRSDTEIVGTAGAFSLRMSVPGGALVPTAGVTMVSVQPTHRRRGLLRAMMSRQLDDIRERGEPLAVLTASEPAIYGRFGYGRGAERLSLAIDSSRTALTPPEGAERVRLRLVPAHLAHAKCEELYARRVPLRPGMPLRTPGWDRLPVLDCGTDAATTSPVQCVTAEHDGEFAGYARYTVRPVWGVDGAEGVVRVRDIEASTPQAYAVLWRYLLDLDLTSSVVADNRPTDDPVLHLVPDIRRCGIRLLDSLYVRLVDVGRALAARTYAGPVDVVLAVEDEFCPWNNGRWHLSGDAKGAVCTRTDASADLAILVRDLGAAYLGGTGFGALAATGRLRELRSGALDHAAPAFHSATAPWQPYVAF
ncbi:GNAT family N-acetyltransferase [Streptomyces canus]|uniref:GNAT family N-acetyltransferase n=1 Tax=Streptomyces canus TaxID=58343 RepID=UPI002E2D4FDF|nr:GNAT family N-acetyltransferase [Streptomyces canus]